MSLGAQTKASGPTAAGVSDEVQSPDPGNRAAFLLARLSVLPALLVTGWLLVGLPLLLAGTFTRVLMLVLSVPVMAVLAYAGWRAIAGWPGRERMARFPGGSAPWWAVIAVVVIAVAFGVDQMIFHSQFIIVTRDPASYVNFGAWISGHGSLPIPQDNAAFGFSKDLSFQSAAYYQVGKTVVPQFMAGLPMVLAGGFWIHGVSAAVAMAPILGACTLLAFGGLVARLVGARWAPLATLALALALPLQFTSRSTYSEPLAAILFLGGLCLVVDCLAANGRAAQILAGMAGLALGLTFLVRLDGASDILPVIPYCGLLFVVSRFRAMPMIAGFVLGAGYGLLDGILLTWPYLQHNMVSVAPLAKIVLVVTALTIIAVLLVKARSTALPRLPNWTAYVVAALPVVIMAGFLVRPYLQITRARSASSFQATIAAYQLAENQPIDPSRQYYEISLHWVFWYIGIPAVILGTAGAALLVYKSIRRTLPAWTLPLLVFSWAIVSTLYRPAITPDQPWASRRLVPAVLPGFLLLAVWFVRWLTGWLRARGLGPVVRGGVVAVCAVALVVPATITTFGLGLHTGGQGGVRLTATGLGLKTTYAGEIAAVNGMCAAIPKDGSVVVVDGGATKVGNQLLEVIRGMCGVPAAIAVSAQGQKVDKVIFDIRRAGRQPVLLAGFGRAINPYGTPQKIMGLATARDGESLTEPPMQTAPFNLAVWMTVLHR
jgi:hypothetical protein